MPNHSRKRVMPAEWERHDATWLAWPHHEDDWPGKFESIPWVMAEIVRRIAGADDAPRRGERVEVLCNSAEHAASVRDILERAHAINDNVRLHVCPTDRSWLRDSAPSFVRTSDGAVEAVRWRFNAWAKYDNYAHDQRVPDFVAKTTGLPIAQATRPDNDQPLVLEGGAIDANGDGVVLVTEECLLDQRTQARNPGLSREDYERAFARWLGAERTVWLGAGCVGDDTHGHIDDIARFVPPVGPLGEAGAETVLLAYEDDPADDNHAASLENEARLGDAGLHVVTVPYPQPVVFEGQRLPASYANFYVCNACVLVPTFNDPNDRVALNTIADLFPDRPTIGVHCLDMVWGLGTIHCLTQQQPAPVR